MISMSQNSHEYLSGVPPTFLCPTHCWRCIIFARRRANMSQRAIGITCGRNDDEN